MLYFLDDYKPPWRGGGCSSLVWCLPSMPGFHPQHYSYKGVGGGRERERERQREEEKEREREGGGNLTFESLISVYVEIYFNITLHEDKSTTMTELFLQGKYALNAYWNEKYALTLFLPYNTNRNESRCPFDKQ